MVVVLVVLVVVELPGIELEYEDDTGLRNYHVPFKYPAMITAPANIST